MCSPSWTSSHLPSPSHPSGSTQCTSPEHPATCIEPGLVICFTYGNIHVSMLFSIFLKKIFIYLTAPSLNVCLFVFRLWPTGSLVVAWELLICSLWELVLWLGVKLWLPALGVQSLSPWTIKEVPWFYFVIRSQNFKIISLEKQETGKMNLNCVPSGMTQRKMWNSRWKNPEYTI